jgi:hypothetical protein
MTGNRSVYLEITSLELRLLLLLLLHHHHHRHLQPDQRPTLARRPFPTFASTKPELLSRPPGRLQISMSYHTMFRNCKLTYKKVATPANTTSQVIPLILSRPWFLFRPPLLLKNSCTGLEIKIFRKLTSPKLANPFMKCSPQPDASSGNTSYRVVLPDPKKIP